MLLKTLHTHIYVYKVLSTCKAIIEKEIVQLGIGDFEGSNSCSPDQDNQCSLTDSKLYLIYISITFVLTSI